MKDLVTIGNDMEDKPAWLMRSEEVIDYEVLVVITGELTTRLRGETSEECIEIDDSRYIESLCMDAAQLFTQHHNSNDFEYWHRRPFLDEIFGFCDDVVNALSMDDGWINGHYRMAHGNQTLDQLLRKYYERKCPMLTLDMAEASMNKDKLREIQELSKGIEDRSPDIASEITRILKTKGPVIFDPARILGSVLLLSVSDEQEIKIDLQCGSFENIVNGEFVKEGSVKYVKKI